MYIYILIKTNINFFFLIYTVSSSKTVSIGFSIKDACVKTVKQEAPINHSIEDIGEARKPNGIATHNRPVYNWEVVTGPNGVFKSEPCNLLMPIIPPMTKMITNSNNRLVNNV